MNEQNKHRESLPSIIVKNKVIFRNPELDLPFDLKEGKQSNLGVFLVNPIDSKMKTNGISLGISFFHGRSGFVGSAICTDSDGRIYYDYDLKGVGLVRDAYGGQHLHVDYINTDVKHHKNSLGLWDLKTALKEKDLTEELTKKGLRTYRIGAIIELEDIALPNGKTFSIKEAQQGHYIQRNERPVVGLRIYRVRKRLLDFIESKDPLGSLSRAKKIVESELNKDLTWQDYFNWFVRTLAKNIAVVHKNGYYHSAISRHNITLAGELVDLAFESGSEKLSHLIFKKRQDKEIAPDLGDASLSLFFFGRKMASLNLIPNKSLYFDSFPLNAFSAEVRSFRKKFVDLYKIFR